MSKLFTYVTILTLKKKMKASIYGTSLLRYVSINLNIWLLD